ncbi:1846_t:CDS:2, partial [Racocetra fulgida]
KYVVENFDQCLTIAYVSILDTGNSNHELNTANIPPYIPHYDIESATTTHKSSETSTVIIDDDTE